jgi:hypothetical protein
MFVRLRQGPRSGEIVEMKFMDAQPLLNDGRAEKVSFDGSARIPVTTVADAVDKARSKEERGKK